MLHANQQAKPTMTAMPSIGSALDVVVPSSSNSNTNNKRNKSRLMALLAVQAMAAASYFLFASPADSTNQHRSLLSSQQPQSRSLMLHSSSSSSSRDWVTWPTVQSAFRKLCGVDERTVTISRSLSIAALDNIIPGFVKGSGDARLHRFLACNVGFNCTYDTVTGYDHCYDGSSISDPYEAFPSDPNNKPVGGSNNIAYMMTISKCPEDVTSLTNPVIDNNVYYDTYAICRHAVCGISTSSEELILGAPPNTKYDYTMYAAIHPDATVCPAPNGAQIDMVTTLMDLGYYPKVWNTPIHPTEVGDDYLKTNLPNDVGFEDLVKLHAFRLTQHPLVMLVEPTTLMLQPIDEIYDSLLADDNNKGAYAKRIENNLIDMGSMIVKPSEAEFLAVKDAFVNTPYTAETGWGGSGIGAGGPGSGGMGAQGFLTYYFEGNPSPPGHVPTDKCVYANDMSAGCSTKTIEQVKIATLSTTCPPAWKCDDAGEESQLCIDFHSQWISRRKDFENMHWKLTPFASRKGMFDVDSFQGYCAAKGKDDYNKMLDWNGEPAVNFDGVPFIPQEIYQDETLVGCPPMDCGEGSYVSADCTCVTDPCSACPEGTRCQNDGVNPIMCIDCTCGFCDYDERPCCDFNGVNNCKAATYRKECKMQNDFFAPFPGTGNVCSGVEISYTATPNGCGCQPNHLTPCTYDPNDRSMATKCSICSAADLVPENPSAPSADSVKTSSCGFCKQCLDACPFDPSAKNPTDGCIRDAVTIGDLEDCMGDLDEQCRTDCHDQCKKI